MYARWGGSTRRRPKWPQYSIPRWDNGLGARPRQPRLAHCRLWVWKYTMRAGFSNVHRESVGIALVRQYTAMVPVSIHRISS
eukprot:8812718-Pyramimonas_sp.AAC.1